MQPPSEGAGNIYDLGYRNYSGARLGRRHAVLSLYLYSLRASFGLGRRTASKVIPISIVIIAFVPALVQLGVAAIANGVIEIIRPENYFGFVEVPVALFCAAVAPELGGKDQRTRTLSLYFSRALQRSDYALAKLAAFTTALLFLTLLPQAVLFIGNALAGTEGAGAYLGDNWKDIPRIITSGFLVAAMAASVSLAIAAQTSRRAYATVAVVALFLVPWPVAGILGEVGGEVGGWFSLLSPFDFLYGATHFIFRESAGADSTIGLSDFPLWLYLGVTLVYGAAGAWVVFRRFERIAA